VSGLYYASIDYKRKPADHRGKTIALCTGRLSGGTPHSPLTQAVCLKAVCSFARRPLRGQWNFPLAFEISAVYQVPVQLDSDGNAAALAEALSDAGGTPGWLEIWSVDFLLDSAFASTGLL
jgi:predicted NBD/HSP70 family sugar kinase